MLFIICNTKNINHVNFVDLCILFDDNYLYTWARIAYILQDNLGLRDSFLRISCQDSELSTERDSLQFILCCSTCTSYRFLSTTLSPRLGPFKLRISQATNPEFRMVHAAYDACAASVDNILSNRLVTLGMGYEDNSY